MSMKSKKARIKLLLEALEKSEPCSSGLLAYKLISQAINRIEDEIWGANHWHPPRSFLQVPVTDRLYPTSYDSMFPVPDWPDVTMLLHIHEIIFISSRGAIQIQRKINDPAIPFHRRQQYVLFDKSDNRGGHVWDF